MKKSNKIIIGVIVVMVALSVAIGGSLFSALNKTKNADYYELGDDRIPSVKIVLGMRDVEGVSTHIGDGATTKTYEYKSDTAAEDMTQYIAHLTANEGFSATGAHGCTKQSAEAGKTLTLELVQSGSGFTLTITKG